MLTVAEARDAILNSMQPFADEAVSLERCVGRVLAQNVVAERDQPPFDRVMMDGIAIAYSDFESGTRTFPIQATQAAGDTTLTLQSAKCIEIMTGSSLPNGADCIVPVERISVDDGAATVEADYEAIAHQFVHPRGSDHAQGTELLMPGALVTPMDVAIVASCGLATVAVKKQPRIVVISTGNELVSAGEPIEDHQIRLSNSPAMIALLEEHGFEQSKHDHIVDDVELLKKRIADHLDNSDVLILSGGVSMGKADFVPQVLVELGVNVVFHKISQRPGKPMWFGIGPKGQTVFALPGNPVSTLVCCRQYVLPALRHAAGVAEASPQFATLASEVIFKPKLTNFLATRLVSNAAGQVLALPVHTNTSGDFTALSGTDGYLELALEQDHFPAGTTVPLHRWYL